MGFVLTFCAYVCVGGPNRQSQFFSQGKESTNHSDTVSYPLCSLLSLCVCMSNKINFFCWQMINTSSNFTQRWQENNHIQQQQSACHQRHRRYSHSHLQNCARQIIFVDTHCDERHIEMNGCARCCAPQCSMWPSHCCCTFPSSRIFSKHTSPSVKYGHSQ